MVLRIDCLVVNGASTSFTQASSSDPEFINNNYFSVLGGSYYSVNFRNVEHYRGIDSIILDFIGWIRLMLPFIYYVLEIWFRFCHIVNSEKKKKKKKKKRKLLRI